MQPGGYGTQVVGGSLNTIPGFQGAFGVYFVASTDGILPSPGPGGIAFDSAPPGIQGCISGYFGSGVGVIMMGGYPNVRGVVRQQVKVIPAAVPSMCYYWVAHIVGGSQKASAYFLYDGFATDNQVLECPFPVGGADNGARNYNILCFADAVDVNFAAWKARLGLGP